MEQRISQNSLGRHPGGDRLTEPWDKALAVGTVWLLVAGFLQRLVTQKDVTCWVDGPNAGRLNALYISQRTTVLRR